MTVPQTRPLLPEPRPLTGPVRTMADLLRSDPYADEIMGMLAAAPRNEPCPCGSGRKAKHCHAR